MALEVHATLLHLEQDTRLPDQVGESSATVVFASLADAEFGLAANFEETGMAKGLEQAVEEDLRLALLVPGDVVLRPADKLSESFLTRHGRSSTGWEGRVSAMKRLSRVQSTGAKDSWLLC